MTLLEAIHERHILGRRARILSRHLAGMLPRGARVLDVGCGDGEIAGRICRLRPDVSIQGVDVLVRAGTRIPVLAYDGRQLPFDGDRFDIVMFVDVLHHCQQPIDLLKEAHRVARRGIVVKDHTQEGILAGSTLRLMDSVGNRRYGVALPYNYWRLDQWRSAFCDLDLTVEAWNNQLGLYPWPASFFLDRQLHFVARLAVASRGEESREDEQVLELVEV